MTINEKKLNTIKNIALDYLQKLIFVHKEIINQNQYEVSVEILRCIENCCNADALYELISDDSENSIGFFAENAEVHIVQSFFQALISIASCIIYAAYRNEGRRYLPEDIESIDEKEIDGFFEFICHDTPTAEVCFEYFCRNVCI